MVVAVAVLARRAVQVVRAAAVQKLLVVLRWMRVMVMQAVPVRHIIVWVPAVVVPVARAVIRSVRANQVLAVLVKQVILRGKPCGTRPVAVAEPIVVKAALAARAGRRQV